MEKGAALGLFSLRRSPGGACPAAEKHRRVGAAGLGRGAGVETEQGRDGEEIAFRGRGAQQVS